MRVGWGTVRGGWVEDFTRDPNKLMTPRPLLQQDTETRQTSTSLPLTRHPGILQAPVHVDGNAKQGSSVKRDKGMSVRQNSSGLPRVCWPFIRLPCAVDAPTLDEGTDLLD